MLHLYAHDCSIYRVSQKNGTLVKVFMCSIQIYIMLVIATSMLGFRFIMTKGINAIKSNDLLELGGN